MRQSHTAHRTVETVHLITIEVVFIRGERCSDFLAGHRICHSAPLPSMLSTISTFLNQKDNRSLHGPVILYQLHYLLFLSGTRTNSTVHPKMSSTTAGRMTFSENMSELDRRSEEHTSELQSRFDLVCRLLLEKKIKTCNGNSY